MKRSKSTQPDEYLKNDPAQWSPWQVELLVVNTGRQYKRMINSAALSSFLAGRRDPADDVAVKMMRNANHVCAPLGLKAVQDARCLKDDEELQGRAQSVIRAFSSSIAVILSLDWWCKHSGAYCTVCPSSR